jgi:branched-chain amino acid transport system ATP-binding protein
MTTPLLDVEAVEVRYGDAHALHGVSLTIAEGETMAVIGANGAGKSTLLKTVAGLLTPSSGRVRYDGTDLTRTAVHRRVAAGISLVPEGRRLFPTLTVRENLQVGAYRARKGPWDLAKVCETFPLVAERLTRTASTLSGGEQQAVAICRALMANPRLLLLDEVSLGLAPVVVRQLYAVLPDIAAQGTTVLVVEQDVRQAMAVADRIHCLLEGRTALEKAAASVTPEEVAHAYFGM